MTTLQLNQNILQEMFDYVEGSLVWKVDRHSNKVKGKHCGTVDKGGYLKAHINRKQHMIHRLIYMWHFGVIEDGLVIDHINRNPSDNRIENLRKITQHQNQFNTNAKGYHWNKQSGKYRAEIKINGKAKYLGSFDNKEDAHNAYLKGKEAMNIFEADKVELIEENI